MMPILMLVAAGSISDGDRRAPPPRDLVEPLPPDLTMEAIGHGFFRGGGVPGRISHKSARNQWKKRRASGRGGR